MGRANDLHSFAASVICGTRGLTASRPAARQPARLLELYEFESCPYCRKVREVLSELDLDYLSRPCAHGSPRRAQVVAAGGKAQFPYLVDPNRDVGMYESDDIITYLCDTYGAGRPRWRRIAAPLATMSAALASIVRPRGGHVRDGVTDREPPARPLELYGFEASPFCRKVREALCELDLEYVVHNVAKRSARRPQLVARGGRMMVPYLIDPNTEVEMYESDDIVAYLAQTYGPPASG